MDLIVDNIRFIPCVHRRVTFAEAVRRVTLEWRPDVIAVELPATLEEWIVRGVLRLPQISAVCYPEPTQPGGLHYIPIDPCDAFIEAVRLGCAHEIPLAFIDLDLPGFQEPYTYVPDDAIVDKTGLEAFVIAVAPYVATAEGDWRALARESHMALRLKELAARNERVLCVVGLAHFLRLRELVQRQRLPDPIQLAGGEVVKTRSGVILAHAARASLGELLGEIPYFTYLFEQSREGIEISGETAFDKFGALLSILREADRTYMETYRQSINLTQWKALLQFTRNLAIVQGRLRPDQYELVIGARGIVDGDYGYEVHELARSYPPQGEKATDLPELKIKQGRGFIEGRSEGFAMTPRWQEAESETIQIGFRRRPPKEMQAQWKEEWERSFHFGICSWPPEDEVQERFMDYLRKRALQVLEEDRKQVQEFSTSMLDGLDIRETVRNWHTGKLYVQSTPRPHGRVGAVVLVFDDELIDAANPEAPRPGIYSWRTTLYAENQNESDISFYATPLGGHVVGPRICRTRFGGILSIYPSQGIPDIWSHRLGDHIRFCSDALLGAAMVFSPDRYIAYVGRKPPRAALKQLAALYQKHIIYLPLHGFSPNHLKKIQNFHILDGRDVRAWARDFIFEN